MGASRADTRPPVSLQLENALGHRRRHRLELLLSDLRKAIKSEQIIEFLKHLPRYIEGDILLIWDRLPAHRSKITQQFIRDQKGRLEIEYLPPYAPELNPVEYIWAHCKHHELPNVCARNLWDLSEGARRSLKRMRRRPRLITAFWKQASLFVCFRYSMRESVGQRCC